MSSIDYTKIDWLKQSPRTLTPELENKFKEAIGKPFFFVFWGAA